jgi:hypothetical protein
MKRLEETLLAYVSPRPPASPLLKDILFLDVEM